MRGRWLFGIVAVACTVWMLRDLGRGGLDRLPDWLSLAVWEQELERVQAGLAQQEQDLNQDRVNSLKGQLREARAEAERTCAAQRDAERSRAELACARQQLQGLEGDAADALRARIEAVEATLDEALRQRRAAEESSSSARTQLIVVESSLEAARAERDAARGALANAQWQLLEAEAQASCPGKRSRSCLEAVHEELASLRDRELACMAQGGSLTRITPKGEVPLQSAPIRLEVCRKTQSTSTRLK